MQRMGACSKTVSYLLSSLCIRGSQSVVCRKDNKQTKSKVGWVRPMNELDKINNTYLYASLNAYGLQTSFNRFSTCKRCEIMHRLVATKT